MKIKHQKKELYDSETFLSPGSGELEIVIGSDNNSIKIILEFIDTDEKEEDFEFLALGDTSLKIVLSNWNNSLGTSFAEPVKIGTLFHKELFILLLVRKIGSQGDIKEITFSAYLGEGVQNGED